MTHSKYIQMTSNCSVDALLNGIIIVLVQCRADDIYVETTET